MKNKETIKEVTRNSIEMDKNLAAVCGLFCPSCIVFIAQRESPEKREQLAKNLNLPVEAVKCSGCRSATRFSYCDSCKLYVCAAEKGIDFCGECDDYPCEELKNFQSALPHRAELWDSQDRIREVGYEKWFAEMLEHNACPRCGTINSAYHLTCRSCGAEPGSPFVEVNKNLILTHMEKRQQEAKK